MNRDDVIRMAREAGLPSSELYHGNLERFAALVAAAEREACARIAERSESALHCAFNIRARGQS